MNDVYFGVCLVESSGEWKEVKGNIDGLSGQKRGENIVRMVSYEDKVSHIIGFYNGHKESEKKVVSQYFQNQEHLDYSYSFDALHTSVTLLETIH
jgi:hypothetical protein